MARATRYSGDKLQLFAATKAAVEKKYQLVRTDETTLTIQTVARWFKPDGVAEAPRGDDVRDLTHNSINFSALVELLPDGDNWIVKVTPKLLRYQQGSPAPETLSEGDISLPGWVQAKTDSLRLDIKEALAQWEAKTVPAQVPAGDGTAPSTESSAPGATTGPTGDGSAAPASGSAATPTP